MDKCLLKKNVDIKWMINENNLSMLESTTNDDNYDIRTGVSMSTHFEPTIRHLTKETRLCHREALNLIMRGHNIRAKYLQWKNVH